MSHVSCSLVVCITLSADSIPNYTALQIDPTAYLSYMVYHIVCGFQLQPPLTSIHFTEISAYSFSYLVPQYLYMLYQNTESGHPSVLSAFAHLLSKFLIYSMFGVFNDVEIFEIFIHVRICNSHAHLISPPFYCRRRQWQSTLDVDRSQEDTEYGYFYLPQMLYEAMWSGRGISARGLSFEDPNKTLSHLHCITIYCVDDS